MARAKVSKSDNLVDPAIKKQFIEMRDHWKTLDDRANSAAAKRRQYQNEIKQAGFKVSMIKDALLLQTPEGEADFKASIANRLLAAAYADADIGEQLSMFLDGDRTPAADRAYKEGQTAAMENKAMTCRYAPETDQYGAFVQGYQEEQERQIKAGITKLEPEPKAKSAKAKKAAEPAKAKSKRGRPPGSTKKANGEAAEAPETRLITKAEKEAKAAARAAAPAAAPPRKPSVAPVTRASLAAQRQAAKDEADSFFTRSSKTDGTA